MSDEKPQVLSGVAVESSASLIPPYEIHGRPAFACVTFNLGESDKVVADAASLLWMDSTTKISTWCHGGFCDCQFRQCSGENGCFNYYQGPGKVTLGFTEPGDMLPFAVTPEHGWILTNQAFVAGSPNVNVNCRFSGCLACSCSGEGAFLTKVTVNEGTGIFFAGGYGERHDIPAGKKLIVDSGLFFAAHANTDIEVKFLSNCCTACLGGEGIVMQFNGPAVIYTQSRDPEIFRRVFLTPPEVQQKAPDAAGAGAEAAAGDNA